MHESRLRDLLLACFDRVVVINLPERADRRRSIDAELRRVGLSLAHPRVEVFAAHRPATAAGFETVGAHGAFQSHLGVMQRAKAAAWSRVLVLEDDMAFTPGFAARLPRLLRALADRPWAMVYGHAGDDRAAFSTADDTGLLLLPATRDLIRLQFLALDGSAMDVLIPALQAMLTRPAGSPLGGPMPVDGALNWVRRDRPDLIALAVFPALAKQRASRSDIAPVRWFDRLPLVRDAASLVRQWRS